MTGVGWKTRLLRDPADEASGATTRRDKVRPITNEREALQGSGMMLPGTPLGQDMPSLASGTGKGKGDGGSDPAQSPTAKFQS